MGTSWYRSKQAGDPPGTLREKLSEAKADEATCEAIHHLLFPGTETPLGSRGCQCSCKSDLCFVFVSMLGGRSHRSKHFQHPSRLSKLGTAGNTTEPASGGQPGAAEGILP